MLGSTVLYVGVVVALLGLATWLRRRLRRGPGRWLALAGVAVALLALMLPAQGKRVSSVTTRLDELIPAYQFSERHVTSVDATCERTFKAVTEVTAPEIALFQTLTWIRRFGRPSPASILNAPENLPMLTVATSTGFIELVNEPPREIVIGTVVVAPPGARRPSSAGELRALSAPGYATALMNFRLEPIPANRCKVTTETRVFATDAASRRRFATYWRVIYPGSALIRRMWLRAVRRRAERSG